MKISKKQISDKYNIKKLKNGEIIKFPSKIKALCTKNKMYKNLIN